MGVRCLILWFKRVDWRIRFLQMAQGGMAKLLMIMKTFPASKAVGIIVVYYQFSYMSTNRKLSR